MHQLKEQIEKYQNDQPVEEWFTKMLENMTTQLTVEEAIEQMQLGPDITKMSHAINKFTR